MPTNIKFSPIFTNSEEMNRIQTQIQHVVDRINASINTLETREIIVVPLVSTISPDGEVSTPTPQDVDITPPVQYTLVYGLAMGAAGVVGGARQFDLPLGSSRNLTFGTPNDAGLYAVIELPDERTLTSVVETLFNTETIGRWTRVGQRWSFGPLNQGVPFPRYRVRIS